METLIQTQLADLDPSWIVLAKPSRRPRQISLDPGLQPVCESVFRKTSDFWKSLDLQRPYHQYTGTTQIRDGLEVTVSPQTDWYDFPRICDLEIPPDFQYALTEYGKIKRMKEKTILPDFITLALRFYHQWPVARQKDKYGLLEIRREYDDWIQENWEDWVEFNRSQFTGWSIKVADFQNQGDIFLNLDQTGNLAELRFNRHLEVDPLVKNLPNLASIIEFRGNLMSRLWHEAKNDTFFPDPWGAKETKRPYFFKDESHWQIFLDKVQRGKKVRDEDRQHLLAWKNYIHFKSVQVLHFKHLQIRPGFKGEIGYKRKGKWRNFVVNNTPSYHRLTLTETAGRLNDWYANKFILNQ